MNQLILIAAAIYCVAAGMKAGLTLYSIIMISTQQLMNGIGT